FNSPPPTEIYPLSLHDALPILLIGAEGTIGIVTAATLRLYPAILDRAAAWVGVADPEDALKILRMMEARTTTIESFEIIPGEIRSEERRVGKEGQARIWSCQWI